MAYSINPLLPKARKWAILLVIRDNLPVCTAARRAGVHRTTLWRWLQRWQMLTQTRELSGNSHLPTNSSRPHHSPRQLAKTTVEYIRTLRERYGRCAPILHAYACRAGVAVSLASVKRILVRLGLVEQKRWKRYRPHVHRPLPSHPGALLQTDVVHFIHPISKQRTYLYTIIDLHSRWAYAQLTPKIGQRDSWRFIQRARMAAPFSFTTIQSDNGGEFGKWFNDTLKDHGITLRHSRVRKPNDNAHIERFNRTIQDECLGRYIPERETKSRVQARLAAYLDFYNNDRLHLGIQCKTPRDVLQRS